VAPALLPGARGFEPPTSPLLPAVEPATGQPPPGLADPGPPRAAGSRGRIGHPRPIASGTPASRL